MPVLQNPRHELFARYRAEGARLAEAYEWAGFSPDSGHASRLAAQEDVADRIAALRQDQDGLRRAERPALIATLMNIAETCLAFGTTDGVREARATLLEAARLRAELNRDHRIERHEIETEGLNQARRAGLSAERRHNRYSNPGPN
jgi:hypothetical protein